MPPEPLIDLKASIALNKNGAQFGVKAIEMKVLGIADAGITKLVI
jgi:hypothetical protein